MMSFIPLTLAAFLGQASLTIDRLPWTVVGEAEKHTFELRKPVARQIETYLRSDGVTNDAGIVAVFVNMWNESSWNPRDVTGPHIGLFQVNWRNKVKAGFSKESLYTVNGNYCAIRSQARWKSWVEATKKSNDAGYLAYKFAAEVEICAPQHRGLRRSRADKWFAALKPSHQKSKE